MALASEALQFLRTTQSGVLSTFSEKFIGYPFGSVAPFILDHSGQPIILISTIAEHTKNIIANPKVSLLVFAGDDDLQANARLTIIGEAVKIDKEKDMKSYPGTVSWISSSAEFTPKVIQTKEERVNLVYAVKVIVKNDGTLKIGMPAEMWIK